MTNYDNSIAVNYNRLNKAVLLNALSDIVNLPLIVLFAFAAYGIISAIRLFVISIGKLPQLIISASALPSPWTFVSDAEYTHTTIYFSSDWNEARYCRVGQAR